MKDFEKIAKLGIATDKKYIDFADRIKNKYKSLFADSKGDIPPVYLRNRIDYKKAMKEIEDFAMHEYFGKSLYKLIQKFKELENQPLKTVLFNRGKELIEESSKISHRKKYKSALKEFKLDKINEIKEYKALKKMISKFVFTGKIKKIPRVMFGGVIPVSLRLDGETDTFLVAVIAPQTNLDEIITEIKKQYYKTFYGKTKKRLKSSKNDDIALYLIGSKNKGFTYSKAVDRYAKEYADKLPQKDTPQYNNRINYLKKNAASIVHQFKKGMPK